MKDGMSIPRGHLRGPGGPFEPPLPRGFGGFGMAHALFPWLFLLLFAALVAVALVALVRFSRQKDTGGRFSGTAARDVAPPSDEALTELRARYARGDIEREEYLQKAADLADTRPIPPSSGRT